MLLSKYLKELACENDCQWIKVCKSLNKDTMLAMFSNGKQFFIPKDLYVMTGSEVDNINKGKVLNYSWNSLTDLEKWCAEKIGITKIEAACVEKLCGVLALIVYTNIESNDYCTFNIPDDMLFKKQEVFNLLEYASIGLRIDRLKEYNRAKEK